MRNKTILLLFYIFSIFLLTPTFTFFFVYQQASQKLFAYIFFQIMCIAFFFLIYFSLHFMMFHSLNEKRKLKEIFGKNVNIHFLHERDDCSYNQLFEKVYRKLPDFNKYNCYEIKHNQKTYLVEFEDVLSYSFKEIVNEKIDVLTIEDITEEIKEMEKEDENLLQEREQQKQERELRKEKAKQTVNQIMNENHL